MMATQAPGHALVMASHRPLTMEALMLKRSSRVMPGLRGTPVAGRSKYAKNKGVAEDEVGVLK